MNVPRERINALAAFGYTDREAEFLYMVATFSGFFLQRQFASHLGINGRGPVTGSYCQNTPERTCPRISR